MIFIRHNCPNVSLLDEEHDISALKIILASDELHCPNLKCSVDNYFVFLPHSFIYDSEGAFINLSL